ncbi:MAG: DNA-3-methyladenine glycosylase 2 family protein, partial [Actinomycetes bacterium]
MKERVWLSGRPISLTTQLWPLRRGTGDPTWATTADGAIWRTTRTPVGAGLERLSTDRAAGSVRVQAWGPGADWLLERLPRLLGSLDSADGFRPPKQLVQVHRRHRGWRVGRTERVMEALIAAILEQKVTGKEAWRAWRWAIVGFGDPAPAAPDAPPGLRVFPEPDVWRTIPSWRWHEFGVDAKRSATIGRVATVAARLEECIELDASTAHVRLRQIPGVGVWTAQEVAQRALGDPDAVSYQDYHLAGEVVYLLTGRRDGTDAQMAQLLTPYAGHRY